ncbi:MAG: hypothetical protein M3Z92_01070, partial [Bacteroidota bacterium]|nr:hypothetical protein [Bacteroidota bacterium]
MKLFFTRRILFLLFILGFGAKSLAQINGDFQSKSSGNWSNFNTWNFYNSGWIPAIPGQTPTGTSNVYIQAAHTISVDIAGAVCNDVDIKSTGLIAFSTQTSVLNIKGNLVTYSAANCFGSWTAGARIVFSGTANQTLPNALGANSVLDHIEVNKTSGILTSGNSFKFNTFTLTSGNFNVASGADVRGNSATANININGGTWTQITSTTTIYNASIGLNSPIGTVTINGGVMILATSTGSAGMGGFQFSTINLINGGVLTLNNFNGNISIATALNVDAASVLRTALTSTPFPASVTFNGLVNYNQAGAQNISGAIYSYLKLSGTNQKTLIGNVTIPGNGKFEMAGTSSTMSLALGGKTLTVSPGGTTLIYSSTANQTATLNEWDPNFQNITIDNLSGVNMAGLSRSISGSLNLVNGTFDIGNVGSLTLNGASLNKTNGFLQGTSLSNLTIKGTTGGTVLLPLSSNISLLNVTIAGTRTMIMDGINNLFLNGVFTIGPTAAYDNGGESQITNGGGSIIINGKYINRDKDDFAGLNGSTTIINPTLNANCTIEFGLAGDQFFTSRTDFKNITFSGSGTKTPSTSFIPTGTLTITGTAILDGTHNIGDGVPGKTNFFMDGGRLILGAIGTQPMMNGQYNLTGGIVQFNSSQATTQTIRSLVNFLNIEVTGNNVGNSNGNLNLSAGGLFIVKTGGIFTINADAINGPTGIQTVTVENGGLFRCGNNEGFHGFISTSINFSSIHQNIENINLLPGSTVEYMRAGDQPVTVANALIYQNLLIAGSGNKIAPASILTIQGNLTKTGTSSFVANGGTVLLNGGSQRFAGLTYNNLIFTNNTKITQGTSTILDSIKVNASTSLTVSPADTIVLHSDALKTARIGQVNGTINNNSRFTAERYISARRAWRFLSAATSSSQTIKDAWQEGALNLSSNPKPGYGTQLTNNAATWAANGFDAMSINGPSMKTFDYISNTYTGISSTLIPFNVSLGGYMTFIRGDRSATAFGSPVTSTVLRTT